MDAADFLGALRGPQSTQPTTAELFEAAIPGITAGTAAAGEPAVLFPTTVEEGLPAEPAPEPLAEEPQERISKDVTPSGIVVEYSSAPKRFYRVNGVEVPSVTTVLGVLDKPGLPWWGMRMGIEGVLELVEREVIKPRLQADTFTAFIGESVAEIEDLLTEHKLTVNHKRDEGGDRGSSVHDAFELWSKTGTLPIPDEFPDHERGYAQGLLAFLTDAQPESDAIEVMVGSAEHGFAGRYDNRLRFTADREVVVWQRPKKQRRDIIPAGKYLVDLKTSKHVYPGSHFRQLEAYEGAGIECGYEPTDGRYVLRVDSEGRYELVRSTADFEDFLAVLAVHESNERLKGGKS